MKTGTAEFEIIISGRGLSLARKVMKYFIVFGLFPTLIIPSFKMI